MEGTILEERATAAISVNNLATLSLRGFAHGGPSLNVLSVTPGSPRLHERSNELLRKRTALHPGHTSVAVMKSHPFPTHVYYQPPQTLGSLPRNAHYHLDLSL